MDITLYLVGTDEEDALNRMPFDSVESASSYADDNPGTHIYSVYALVYEESIEEVQ
jgi:hypothetical protein